MIAHFPSSQQRGQQKDPLQWSRITLIGPDARDFLHRVTTVNTKTLAIGQGASGCLLTPQGRILNYFHLWCDSENTFAFELDPGPSQFWKTQLFTTIDHLTFAERMTLTDRSSEMTACWLFPETGEEMARLAPLSIGEQLTPLTTVLTANGLRFSHQGSLTYGRPWITVWGPGPTLQAGLQTLGSSPLSQETLERWRIQAAQPRVDFEITADTLPLEVGLHTTIADNKGCYPGQEVIEKMISLGSPPRRLIQLHGTGLGLTPLTAISLTEGPEIGKLTSVTYDGAQFTALGLVKKMHAKVGLEVRFSNECSCVGIIQSVVPFTSGT